MLILFDYNCIFVILYIINIFRLTVPTTYSYREILILSVSRAPHPHPYRICIRTFINLGHSNERVSKRDGLWGSIFSSGC